MRAIVLAAGRGERMRPLTDGVPKPLLEVGGRALIEYHLHALAAAGVRQVVVNLSWLGERIRAVLGDGSGYGLQISYSEEGPVPLETGGGIERALPLLGEGAFLVVNGDVWTDQSFAALEAPPDSLAHLLLVANPAHHPRGDFALGPDGRIGREGDRLTYAGIGLIDPALFAGCAPGRFPLKPLLDRALEAGRLTGQRLEGHWIDVGTPARLAELDARLRSGSLRHPSLPRQPAGGPG